VELKGILIEVLIQEDDKFEFGFVKWSSALISRSEHKQSETELFSALNSIIEKLLLC